MKTDERVISGIGKIFVFLKMYDEAVLVLKQAILLDRSQVDTIYTLGVALISLNQLDEA